MRGRRIEDRAVKTHFRDILWHFILFSYAIQVQMKTTQHTEKQGDHTVPPPLSGDLCWNPQLWR